MGKPWKHGLAVILLSSHFGYVGIQLEDLKYAISASINVMKVILPNLSCFSLSLLYLLLCYNLNNIPLKSCECFIRVFRYIP